MSDPKPIVFVSSVRVRPSLLTVSKEPVDVIPACPKSVDVIPACPKSVEINGRTINFIASARVRP